MQRLGWIISAILATFLLCLLTRDGEENPEIEVVEIMTDSSYAAYSVTYEENQPVVLWFFDDGNLRYLGNFIGDNVQHLDFHKNGQLAVKTTVDSLDNIQNGRYYFYDSNGNLSYNYNYIDNNKVGVAKSYHPNSPYLKEYMEYDSLGQMHYRRTYDKFGNTIKEEGKKIGEE